MITKTRRLRLGWRTPFPELRSQPARPIPPPALPLRITRPTAILIDKSQSMGRTITLGQRVLELVSPLCQAGLHAYAFDTMAYAIRRNAADAGRWDGVMSRIVPGGFKACGAAVECMRMNRERVEQLVLITDQRENASPTFVEAYQTYAQAMGVLPRVRIIRPLDSSGWLEHRCYKAGVPFETLDEEADELSSLIPLLV
ncbi:MAG TPA: hypothetical protein VHP11_00860 [Tepidisphaeraceae bacterium]|nr:hypothetical protein [Tepidisphaeraceae bacterium]